MKSSSASSPKKNNASETKSMANPNPTPGVSEKTKTTKISPPELPERSTQSPSVSELYPPSAFKVLRISDIMKEKTERQAEKKAEAVPLSPKAKERAVLDQQLFDKHYGYRRVDLTLGRKVHWHYVQITKWKRQQWLDFAFGRVPITRWLWKYQWKQWIMNDVIGGIMVSVMSVPQGLAYGFLVGVPPNYGLITGIFGPLIYSILGSSRHTSPGAFAIVSLMVGSAVESFASSQETQSDLSMEAGNATMDTICCSKKTIVVPEETAVGVAASITFLIGICQILFGILNVGLLAVWLSDQLVQGLTSGAAIHVLTSQIKSMTGVQHLPPTSEAFGLIKFYICFFSHIKTYNSGSCIISLISITLLLMSSYFFDPIIKKWTKIKFPMELVLVASTTILVWLANGTEYDLQVPIVGKVNSGLVAPRFPPYTDKAALFASAIPIAVISFVIHIALAKLVSKKLNYEIDANQEWFALGGMHTISSMFGCFAGGSSLGRTMMQVKFGTNTQLSSIVCAAVLLIFVYGAATLIYYLPKAVLATIVVIAMKDLFIQLFKGFRLIRESMVDFLIFIVTLVAVILINVNYGLMIGVAFALLTVVFRTQWAESTCMGRIPGTADFKGLGHYISAEEIPGIKVFRFDAPLYFANAETFLSRMHASCGVNPLLVRAKIAEKTAAEKKRQEKSRKRREKEGRKEGEAEPLCKIQEPEVEIHVKNQNQNAGGNAENLDDDAANGGQQLTHIIIDCSSIPYIDLMGKDALAQTYVDYASIDVTVLYSHCKVAVRQMFEQTDFYTRVPKNRMFVSLDDAVTQAQREQSQRVQTAEGQPKPTDTASNIRQSTKNQTQQQQQQQPPIAHSPAQKTVVADYLGTAMQPSGSMSGSALSTAHQPEEKDKEILKTMDEMDHTQ